MDEFEKPSSSSWVHKVVDEELAKPGPPIEAASAESGRRQDGGDASEPPRPVLADEAYQGLVGEFVRAVEPYSEADPAALLLHTLVGAGCLIGRGPHVLVECAPHHARLNVCVVGRSANARKGTAWQLPRALFSHVDGEWVRRRVCSGLSSGEGLVYPVRDGNGEDSGEQDKRLLVIEQEFAGVLKAMQREGNTLSARIREAWDHGTLTPMTKKDRLQATDAHICIIAHITEYELLRLLNETERANGFANRFLFALVQRSKYLPSGGGPPREVWERFPHRFSHVIRIAQKRGQISRDQKAEKVWESVYVELEQDIPGISGAILARAAAQVLRLSLLYSLLDENEARQETPAIRSHHVLAAVAVWNYCRESVFRIFGDAIGDPIADRLLRLIQDGPRTDTELSEALGRHLSGKHHALNLLVRLGRVHSATQQDTGGRPKTWWHAGPPRDCRYCEKSEKRGGKPPA